MTKLTEGLRKPITTLEEAKAWIEELNGQGLLFHFDDNPETVGNIGEDGKWVDLFTKEEAAVVRKRVGELYNFEWSAGDDDFECPIGYALHVMGED